MCQHLPLLARAADKYTILRSVTHDDLDHGSATYLALTGHRLNGAECCALGLATHYIPSADLDEAKRHILADPTALDAILSDLLVPAPEADW